MGSAKGLFLDREERCVAEEEDDDESTSVDVDEARRPPFCIAANVGVAMNRAVAKIMVTRGECRCRCCIMMFFFVIIIDSDECRLNIVEPNKTRELQDESFCCCCILALFCKPIVSPPSLASRYDRCCVDVVVVLQLVLCCCVVCCCGANRARGCGCRNFHVNSKA